MFIAASSPCHLPSSERASKQSWFIFCVQLQKYRSVVIITVNNTGRIFSAYFKECMKCVGFYLFYVLTRPSLILSSIHSLSNNLASHSFISAIFYAAIFLLWHVVLSTNALHAGRHVPHGAKQTVSLCRTRQVLPACITSLFKWKGVFGTPPIFLFTQTLSLCSVLVCRLSRTGVKRVWRVLCE